MMAAPEFQPEFASPAQWAAMYRACGIQVIPARYPMRTREDKRPALASWRQFQEELVNDTVFASWFPINAKPNMGCISGRASNSLVVIDLDEHSNPSAGHWWRGVLLVNNYEEEPETWVQQTGGGGRQWFFEAPPGWHVPTNRTPLGVDIRGQGGFAMLPPSIHLTGRAYEWLPGRAPWEIEIARAPDWLLDAIDALVEQYGGDTPGASSGGERTADPGADFNAFWSRVDGRESAMRDRVWHGLLEMIRAYGEKRTEEQETQAFEAALARWHQDAKTRLKGVENEEGLERECRGRTMFLAKWQDTKRRKWARLLEEAAKPRPFEEAKASDGTDWSEAFGSTEETGKTDDAPIAVGDLKGEPKPRLWLVQDWIPLGVVSSLSGDGGVGKTLLAQMLLYAGGIGAKWLGFPVPAVRGLGVFCEDDRDELHRRHDAIKAALGYPVGNPFNATWIWPRVGHDNLLVTFDRDNRPTASKFFLSVQRYVVENKIELLTLDTIADLFGGNEIVRAQVNFFIKSVCGGLIRVAAEKGWALTVLLLSHPSQAGRNSGTGESGSTAWNNSVRSRLYLTKVEDGLPEARQLTRKKANYASSGDDTTLDLIWKEGVLVRVDADPETSAEAAVEKAVRYITEAVATAWHGRDPYKQKRDGLRKNSRFLDAAMMEQLQIAGVAAESMQAALIAVKRRQAILPSNDTNRRGWMPALRG